MNGNDIEIGGFSAAGWEKNERELAANVEDMTADQVKHVQLLVAALRSGNFHQGKSKLTTVLGDGGHRDCCLGVGCKVAIGNGFPLTVRFESRYDSGGADILMYGFGAEATPSVLPVSVQQWYGFGMSNPWLRRLPDDRGIVDGPLISAAQANDGMDWNYDQIADGFERTYVTPNLDKLNGGNERMLDSMDYDGVIAADARNDDAAIFPADE